MLGRSDLTWITLLTLQPPSGNIQSIFKFICLLENDKSMEYKSREGYFNLYLPASKCTTKKEKILT